MRINCSFQAYFSYFWPWCTSQNDASYCIYFYRADLYNNQSPSWGLTRLLFALFSSSCCLQYQYQSNSCKHSQFHLLGSFLFFDLALKISILGAESLEQLTCRRESCWVARWAERTALFFGEETKLLLTLFNKINIDLEGLIFHQISTNILQILNYLAQPGYTFLFFIQTLPNQFLRAFLLIISDSNSQMQAIKNKFIAIKDLIVDIFNWIRNKYRNNRKKCRGVLLTVAILTLLTGLIVGSFKSVDSISQGVPINYSEGVIKDSTKANQGSFVGLNTYYYTLPSHSYLISFNSQTYDSKSTNSFPSISARAIQGIKVLTDVDAQVKISPLNLKSFLEEFGMEKVDEVHAGWQIYIKEKIKNVVIQAVGSFKFYQITNKDLASAINTQFTNYLTQYNFPYLVTAIGINIHYPQKTMNRNDTLGIKLLKQTSKLQQLNTQLALLNNQLSTYQSYIDNYTNTRATIDGMIVSREESVKISNGNWIQGVNLLNQTFNNQTLLQKYLQLYFNHLYNATYRLDTIYPFQI